MQKKVVVFDFDGTCTVPIAGADAGFLAAYQQGFATFLGKPLAWVVERFVATRQAVAANPNIYGWEMNGRIIAPALIDAFVEAHVCAQLVLKEIGENIESWVSRLEELYQVNYLKHQTTFRPEMLEVFRSLKDRGIPFYIVSNSDPAKVQKRLAALGEDAEWVSNLVRGYAKKYITTPGPKSVPESMLFPGLQRLVELRKQKYYDILVDIIQTHGIYWDELTVVGDIAELDLAMPVTMGAQGCLMVGENTPSYERQWAEEHPRVKVISNLREVIT